MPIDQDAAYKVSAVDAGVTATLVPQNATAGFGAITSIVIATTEAGNAPLIVGRGILVRLLSS